MTLTLASFLAGSLLTMLMPILLFVVLVSVLFFYVARRVPGGDASAARRATQAEHAAPAAAPLESLSPPSGDPPVEEM
jgi:hypothetical protein